VKLFFINAYERRALMCCLGEIKKHSSF